MSAEKESYKQIFKTTSIFGGIQIFNILISIAKSKIIAVLLGPAGLGLISIFNSTSTLIASLTNLGISVSAVKSIASAAGSENKIQQSVIIAVIKKIIWITGFLSFLVTVALSPWLSKISFGNSDYTFSFAFLGLSLLTLQLSIGYTSILQGLRQVKLIALSSLIGAVIGLLVSVPLYFYFGSDGIVPALVASSIAAFIASWYFLNKINIDKVKVNSLVFKKEGEAIIKLGFLISLTSIFPSITGYILRLFISNVGSIEDVGLYTAGFAIVGTYVGMVFSAMSIDYYPSLAEIAGDDDKCTEKVNQQILVSALILAPILTVLIIFIKEGIVILYSSKFLGTVKMIQWASLGVFFQAFSFCIAYLFLAKGNSKLFFWNEIIPNIYILFFNCICFKIGGLEGLGISFLIGYLCYFIQVFIIAKHKYGFKFERGITKICSLLFLIMVLTFLSVSFLNDIYQYILCGILIISSFLVSFKTLKKRTGFLINLKKNK